MEGFIWCGSVGRIMLFWELFVGEAVDDADSVVYSFFVRAGDVPDYQARGLIFFCVVRTGQGAGRKDRYGRVLPGVSVASHPVVNPPIVRREVCVFGNQFVARAEGGPNDEPYAVHAFIGWFVGLQVGLCYPTFNCLRR